MWNQTLYNTKASILFLHFWSWRSNYCANPAVFSHAPQGFWPTGPECSSDHHWSNWSVRSWWNIARLGQRSPGRFVREWRCVQNATDTFPADSWPELWSLETVSHIVADVGSWHRNQQRLQLSHRRTSRIPRCALHWVHNKPRVALGLHSDSGQDCSSPRRCY